MINVNFAEKIAGEMSLDPRKVQTTIELLQHGATIPFIARYRKERTGSLNEVQLIAIRNRLAQLKELESRRNAVIKSLSDRNLLTEALERKISAVATLSELEDIYLPFRPKRRTRATIAREKGLEPLAMQIMDQAPDFYPDQAAAGFIDAEKGVHSAEEALQGALDIIAEKINENAEIRSELRELFWEKGVYHSRMVRGRDIEGRKFSGYFDWKERVKNAPSHRVLAMRRGEKEGVLSLKIKIPEDEAIEIITSRFIKGDSPSGQYVAAAIKDSCKRLLFPSLETETRARSKYAADGDAIHVFMDNLRQLLLSPPLGQKRILAVDPGYRTGCKIVCLDSQGKLLHFETIFPHSGTEKAVAAAKTVRALCNRFEIQVIAVGNGTAGRETERFIRDLKLPGDLPVIMVNESGASIYSASEVAREEFPDQDITVRGAVSIGRRLMDPLAELVKIDPKAIGVGQYQHDVDQKRLRQSLDDVVTSCVNHVGVELNTACPELLRYVSGLGPVHAKNIIAYRNEHGPFTSRSQLRKVPRLGPKAFEQAAGFLRISGAENPLDATAVHPESYPIVEKMAEKSGCDVKQLIRNPNLLEKINPSEFITDSTDIPTITDILTELAKPGRDPRESFESIRFADEIRSIDDLRIGMKLPGVVTNITRFGAFVDIGIHQDGLVHISRMADHFVRDPAELVRLRQRVDVTVIDVDLMRKRIALSMESNPKIPGRTIPSG